MHEPKMLQMRLYVYILMLYYCIAPLEDFLTGSAGTVAKYVSILFVLAGIVTTKLRIVFDRKDAITHSIIYMLFLFVFSLIWAIDKRIAFERIQAYILLPSLALFAMNLHFNDSEYESLEKAIVFGGLITVLFLVFQKRLDFFNGNRLTLTEHNDPNNFAALLLLPFVMSWKMFKSSGKGTNVLYLTFSLIFVLVVFMTGSRGALLALIVFFIVLFALSGRKKKALLILVVPILLYIIWRIVWLFLPEYLKWRLFNPESYFSSETSSTSRTAIWRITIHYVIPRMPLWGLGAGCAPVALKGFFGMLKGVHNTYLNMLCEFGVLGLPVFFYFIIKVWKELKSRNLVVECALLAAFCIIIFFLDSFAKKFFWNVVLLLLIKIRLCKITEQSTENKCADTFHVGKAMINH